MKRFLLVGLLLFILYTLSAQQNFNWVVIDSTAKSKAQIYSATKVFIAETWRSAQDVIQNDDKEGGMIIVKGSNVIELRFFGADYIYDYRYTVSFQMKENKYRMILKDVYNEYARMGNGSIEPTKIQPFEGDNCPPTGTFAAPGLPKKQAIPMMAGLKRDLQSIVDSYKEFMAQSEVVDDNW